MTTSSSASASVPVPDDGGITSSESSPPSLSPWQNTSFGHLSSSEQSGWFGAAPYSSIMPFRASSVTSPAIIWQPAIDGFVGGDRARNAHGIGHRRATAGLTDPLVTIAPTAGGLPVGGHHGHRQFAILVVGQRQRPVANHLYGQRVGRIGFVHGDHMICDRAVVLGSCGVAAFNAIIMGTTLPRFWRDMPALFHGKARKNQLFSPT